MFKILTCSLAFVAVAASSAAAQDNWSWHKALAAGKTIEVKNIEGTISATPASGDEVQVIAHKRGDTRDVDIKVEEDADGVTICTIYDDGDDCGSRGNNRRHHNVWRDRDDGRVDFEVRVPRGVRFAGRSVSGDVEATGMTADVTASSVSGDVRVATTGIVEATSVSGSIHASMGRMDWDDLSFSTVSGDIVLTFAQDLNATVKFHTVSGDFESDWPMTVTSTRNNSYGPRGGLSGTIGSGGHRLAFNTVSGDVELRKAH
jgi:hypothetical protein